MTHPPTYSAGELEFDFQANAVGLPASEPEYRFLPPRRFRFDRAWPKYRVALEVEGGTWTGGRHTRGKGYEKDCEKYSLAAAHGWLVIRATTGQVKSGEALRWVEMALKAREPIDAKA